MNPRMTPKPESGSWSNRWLTRHAHPNWEVRSRRAARNTRAIRHRHRHRPSATATATPGVPPSFDYGGGYAGGYKPVPRGNAAVVLGQSRVLDLGRGLHRWHPGRGRGHRRLRRKPQSPIALSPPCPPSESTSSINSSPRTTPRSPGPSGSKTATPSAGPSTSPTPPAGGTLTVTGINENKTITCNDSVVSVSGVSNKVVITGHCASLTVSGMQNKVTVDAADTIDASGLNNKSPITRARRR